MENCLGKCSSTLLSVKPASACELNVGALVVFDQQQLVGILSERDIIRRCLGVDLPVDETAVAMVMTKTHHY